MQICECGCGQAIQPKRWHKYTKPRCLPGHVPAELAARRGASKTYKPRPEEIPSGLCECGCGRRTGIAKITYIQRRHFRGHPAPFISGHKVQTRGPERHNWKGGRMISSRGYVLLLRPDHPRAQRSGYIYEHRLVMEEVLGRLLEPHEVVHHRNQVKTDNRPENLELMTVSEHNREHKDERLPKMWAAQTFETQSAAGKRGAAKRWGHQIA